MRQAGCIAARVGPEKNVGDVRLPLATLPKIVLNQFLAHPLLLAGVDRRFL
jgi:hypothetical protein